MATNVNELIELVKEGDLNAMVDLGTYYLYKTDPEYQQAWVLLQDAALNGHGDAQLHLGKMYENGWYVEKDIWTAINLYKRAYSARTVNARKALGDAYAKVCEDIEITGKASVNEDFEIEACCHHFLEGIRMGRIMPKEDEDKVSFYLVNMNSEVPIEKCLYCGGRLTYG